MPLIPTTSGQELFSTEIQYFGKRCLAVCDRLCSKAWGISGGRPEQRSTIDEDDVVWFADSEVGEAPSDPGTYEADHGKPLRPPVPPERHNKWCVRECERSKVIDIGKSIECDDWSQRIYNQPWKHGLTDNPKLKTETTFE